MRLSERSGKLNKGFTLIELVMVIVILGILAAVALPKFVDLSGKAGAASASGVAGAISAGSAANFTAKKAGLTAVAMNAAEVCDAAILGGVVQGGLPATGFTIGGTGDCSALPPTVTCTVTSASSAVAANATVYCTAP